MVSPAEISAAAALWAGLFFSPPLVFGLSLIAISEGELALCVSNLVDLEPESEF